MERIGNLTAAALNSSKTTPPSTSSDSWKPTLDAHEETLQKAAAAAAKFVAEIAEGGPGRWLTLTGITGCGKTMLARQVYEEARKHNTRGNAAFYERSRSDEGDRRPQSVWMTATQFADRMRAGKEYDLPEYLSRDFLVVIDDVGTARDTTQFIADGLYRLANVRLGKWTVFTTNLTLRELAEQIDPRFASRVIRDENVLARIDAPDYAMIKKGLVARGKSVQR